MQNTEIASASDRPAASRSRGRPRAFDRDAALAQATHLFWRKGFEATSIADLTAAMGIGSPSLYAAFGSKEALFVEALRHYADNYDALAWAGFRAAATAHDAMRAFLMDSAVALTGSPGDRPAGCMVTLSSVSCGEHATLAELVRAARAMTLGRLEARLRQGVADGELSASLDLHALARFIQTVQSGMSILARDGAGQDELEASAEIAMLGWRARTSPKPVPRRD